MSEMVARVLNAIEAVACSSTDSDIGRCSNLEKCLCGERMARAAIEAMRDPTNAMVQAGTNKWCERAWEAMIDEALK